MVAGLTNEEIANLNQELESMGILTQEEADNAAYLNDRITDFKKCYLKDNSWNSRKIDSCDGSTTISRSNCYREKVCVDENTVKPIVY